MCFHYFVIKNVTNCNIYYIIVYEVYLFIFHLYQHKKLPDGHEERIVVRNDEGKKKKIVDILCSFDNLF